MSFCDQVKNEIFSKNIKERHCKLAFIAGIVRGAGSLYEKDGDIGLEIRVSNEELSTYIADYLRNLFSLDGVCT